MPEMLNAWGAAFAVQRFDQEDWARQRGDRSTASGGVCTTMPTLEREDMTMPIRRIIMMAVALCTLAFGAAAQHPSTPYVRWVELEVAPADIDALPAAGRLNTEATMAAEPGVLAFHSAVEKDNPARMRVLEIYADADAYRAHLQSAHFQKFVRDLQPILRSRAVFETVPVLLGAKPQLPAASRTTHVRAAELEIDPTQLDAYRTAVTEEIQDSIRLEPGVLAIYCVALKDQPSQLRFFEVYADEGAYRRHIESPHFKKYVDTTKSMIRARKLFEMASPTLAAKNR
jgi:quinol monooxygenase YgiN